MNSVQTSEPSLASLPSVKSGKDYRLFKRDPATGRELPKTAPGWKDLPYYFRLTVRGKSYSRNLGTNVAEDAQKYARAKAREIKGAVVRNDHAQLDRTKARQVACATVAQILATYQTIGVDASADTRRQNAHALKLILGKVYAAEDPTALSLSQLTAGAAQLWFKQAQQTSAAEPDQRQAASIKRSANSRFAHARSIFTPTAIAEYKQQGLLIPECVQQFIAGTNKFRRLPRADYNPPSDTIIQTTLQAWEALEDRDLFLAIGHELAFGLRKGELAQAKWNWWSVRQGYPVLDGSAHVKNLSGFLQVRALNPWFDTMRSRIEAKNWRAQPDDYIISGNASNREDSIFRAVGMWLRGLGWETQKTNHALRAYAGSQIAMKYGIYEAQTWLRHSTVKVTENHYSQFVKRFKPSDPDSLPAKWATIQSAAPQLHILPAIAS